MIWGAILLAMSLSIIHFFSEVFARIFDRFHFPIVSFSSGFFLSLIFLELLPEVVKGINYIDVPFALFMGFVAFHLAEKYVYQHVKNKKEMLRDIKYLHETGFFIEHFLIGFFLVLVFRLEGLYMLLVFVPLILHTISSSLTMEAIHLKAKSTALKFLLSISTTIGAFVAMFITPMGAFYYGFFSLALGALFYIGVRDMLPLKRGSPFFFVFGATLNFSLFAIARMF